MKKIFFTAAALLFSSIVFSQSKVYVKGYYKSNGKYVSPHYRTSPNNTVKDNWSTYPNVNPYNGKKGTKKYNNNYYEPFYSHQPHCYPSSMCNSIPEKIKIAKLDGPKATNASGTCSVNANDSKIF